MVFATGQPPVLDGLPLNIPSDRVKGHLLVTEATPIRLPGIVAPVATQLEDGRLLAGGTFDIGDEDPAVQPQVIESIMDGLVAALPAAKGLGIAYQWCCFRPRHPDRRPVIDRVPGLDNAWLTSGHFRTGILNAPATASVLARWISAGQPAEPGRRPGARLGRGLADRDPAREDRRRGRGVEYPGPEVPRGEPGIVQAGNPVDDRPPVGMAGPEAAPLVRDAQPLRGRQRGDQAIHDRLDHVGLDGGVLVPDVEGPAR